MSANLLDAVEVDFGDQQFLFVGGASGQYFAGVMYDRYGDYRAAFATFAVLNLLGLLSLGLLRDERTPRASEASA